MECLNCFHTRDLCVGNVELGNGCFYLTLLEGFKWMVCIPCFARPDLLRKLNVAMDKGTSTTAYLRTKEGFSFKTTILNEKERTYFGSSNWGAFAKAYKFEEGMAIHFDFSKYSDPDPDILVDLENIPILPPYYFLAPKTTQEIVDNIYYTADSALTWKEKNYLVSFVNGIEWPTNTHNAGKHYASYVPLVHALNKTNIQNKCLKLPRCVVPDIMDGNGEMTLIYDDKTNFKDTYSTVALPDGRLLVNGWRRILKECNLEIGARLISVLHHGSAGIFLFLTSIPKRED
ncbi:uncharacterized protein LOC119271473 [Triticum dicoccoides]|uniref:uncharacterized protein LOC119271473 n=1 Tax=Triticum dicoccoides TaxID=85692 RepID=UPI000E7AC0B0|nr:uncharacterized protein LOC119271473 [Triticum dicoccoides]